jgi:hypothetical protein
MPYSAPANPNVITQTASTFIAPVDALSWLLANVTTAPYEGLWLPNKFSSPPSLEVFGSEETLSLQLLGTNADAPSNEQTLTLAGTFAEGDILTLNFTPPGGPAKVVTSTLGANPTSTTAAAELASAVNAAQPFGVSAQATAGVITLTYPSWQSGDPYQQNTSVRQNLFTISAATTGAETFAVASGTDGSTLGAAITALGIIQLAVNPRWIKARVTTLTGSGALISAALHGVSGS